MKIYTKTGDKMETSAMNRRVFKDDLVIHAVGTCDELSSSLMVSYHFIENEEIKAIIEEIVSDLFKVSADIIGYKDGNLITPDRVTRFEELIDSFEVRMPKLTKFIVQGKNKGSSHLHVSRTVSRRLERFTVSYAREGKLNNNVLLYLNRLSDLLFVMARYLDHDWSNYNNVVHFNVYSASTNCV